MPKVSVELALDGRERMRDFERELLDELANIRSVLESINRNMQGAGKKR
jgi:hypothetical protein